jgi:hypothetical protein
MPQNDPSTRQALLDLERSQWPLGLTPALSEKVLALIERCQKERRSTAIFLAMAEFMLTEGITDPDHIQYLNETVCPEYRKADAPYTPVGWDYYMGAASRVLYSRLRHVIPCLYTSAKEGVPHILEECLRKEAESFERWLRDRYDV